MSSATIYQQDMIERYVLRRTIHTGQFRRSDLDGISEGSAATKYRLLNQMCSAYSNLIYQDKRCYRPHSYVALDTRDPNSANSILNEILFSPITRLQAGLDIDDAPGVVGSLSVQYGKIRAQRLPDEVDYTPLLHAMVHKKAFSVRYVGRKKNDQARWRCIYPVALHRIADQLLVTGYDFDEFDAQDVLTAPLKQFVLFRMLELRPLSITPSIQLQIDAIKDSGIGRATGRWYVVSLNPKMTPDQSLAARRELGLDSQNRILLDDASLFHFRQRHLQPKAVTSDCIDPVAVSMEAITS